MCMKIDADLTVEVMGRMAETDSITAYKVLLLSKDLDSLVSPCQKKLYHPEINSSNRESTSVTEEETSSLKVVNGIHVFLNRYHANSFAEYINGAVIPVTCLKKDLVAAGNWKYRKKVDSYYENIPSSSAVFTKIDIDEFDYNMALKALQFAAYSKSQSEARTITKEDKNVHVENKN